MRRPARGGRQFGKRGAVALYRAFNSQIVPRVHNRHAVRAKRAGYNYRVAGFRRGRGNIYPVGDFAHSGCRYKNLVGFAVVHHFGVAGDNQNASFVSRRAH